jgi:predicted nucleic acid-binding protein
LIHVFLDSAIDPSYLDTLETKGDLVAPHLIDLEFLNAIRKQLRLKLITEKRASQALFDLNDLELERKTTQPLNNVIWGLRNNFTPYDAAYVALAADLAIPFLTRDQKLAEAVRAHTKVELV